MPESFFRFRRFLPPPRLLFVAAALLVTVSVAVAADDPRQALDDFYDRWHAAALPFLLDAEDRVYRALDDDFDRERFIEGFWRMRGEAALARWGPLFTLASERFDDLREDRARALLVAGKPESVILSRPCGSALRGMEAWVYTPWHVFRATGDVADEGFVLLFVEDGRRGSRRYRLWSPADGAPELTYLPSTYAHWDLDHTIAYAHSKGCFEAATASVFEHALRRGLDRRELEARLVRPPADAAWLGPFLDSLDADTDVDTDTEGRALPLVDGAALEIDYPGRYSSQTRTIVHGRVSLPVEALTRNAAGRLHDRLVLRGDVRQGGRYYDAFVITHYIAGAAPTTPTVEIDLYRRLRPATYALRLRVETGDGRGLLRVDQPITVPPRDREAPAPAGYSKGFAALLRPEVGVLTTFPSIEVSAPDEPAAGRVEVEARTAGGPIDRVVFHLDGETSLEDRDPPWTAVFDLGATPERRRIEAVAIDPGGRELARDALEINAHAGRLAVRLLEPRRGGPTPTRIRAAVEVPEGEEIERVELYLDQDLLATLHEPPWDVAIPADRRSTAATPFARVVARLRSGAVAEDLVLFDSRYPLESIDVHLVEVYASVTDSAGRPIDDLRAQEARVLEDGEAQTLSRFDRVENLAIHVALMMDASASMRHRIELAAAAARRFFEKILTPKDRAELITFHHAIRRRAPFTNDIDLLRDATRFLKASGTTRLYDSLIWTLHGFGGLDGKRALIVLSDGLDVDSDFSFKQVREAALRASVAVYPIVLDLSDETSLALLRELADVTGGRYFEPAGIQELDRVYRRIEQDLRSQYLFVYEGEARASRAFRRTEVEILRQGAKARASSGYYP